MFREEPAADGPKTKNLQWAIKVYNGNLVADMPAAYELLKDYPREELNSPQEGFEFAAVAALICHRLYKGAEAKQYASEALQLAPALEQGKGNQELEAAFNIRLQELQLIVDEKELI